MSEHARNQDCMDDFNVIQGELAEMRGAMKVWKSLMAIFGACFVVLIVSFFATIYSTIGNTKEAIVELKGEIKRGQQNTDEFRAQLSEMRQDLKRVLYRDQK